MKKKILSLSLLLVFVISILAGCGSKEATSTRVDVEKSYGGKERIAKNQVVSDTYTGSVEAENGDSNSAAELKDNETGIIGTGTDIKRVANEILTQRKIIRNANVSIEVKNFEQANSKIEAIVEGTGTGYIQETNINRKKRYINGEVKYITSAVIIARVSADEFSDKLTAIKGLGTLQDLSIKSDDVTDKFYDVESELRLLKYEQSRLEEYLKKISDPDTIFKTESRLTEIRHQIERLTGTLNKMSDLVKLSTITINVNEQDPDSEEEVKDSYIGKLLNGFKESLGTVVAFLGGLLLFLVEAIPVLIMMALFFFAGYKTYKVIKKKRSKKAKNTTSEDDKDVSL